MSSRRSRARRRPRNTGVIIARFAFVALALVLVLAISGAASAYGLVTSWLQDLPDYESPEAFSVAQATTIYSADGVLLARLFLENRTVVPLSKISTDLVEAVVAVEDERFYQHNGIDLIGISRAAVNDIVAGSAKQGASTITQQYIRNTVLLEERTDISLKRKVREAFLAMELEKRKSKDEVLELYLNAIYFGEGAYGAQSASQTFFSKNANELTLAEAALLAGLPQQPSRLSPYDNPDGALRRRTQVLYRMYQNDYITREEYDAAKEEPLTLKRAEEPEHGIYRYPFFVAHVKKLLQAEYDQSLVFQGGLTVHTTLDTRLQKYAEDAVSASLGRPGDPDVALVSLDPRNGYIKALVGGRDYSQNKFNLATQGRRQPGSSFKTFVLVAALEEGMPPTRYVDSSSPARIPTTPVWDVSNSEGRGRGLITIDSAMRSSVNTVFARMIWDLNEKDGGTTGAQKVADLSRRMGITSDMPAYPSIALGSQNVTPLEMASAFGTLATNGLHFPPVAITKVLGPDGSTVFEEQPEGVRAVSPEIAYATTSILKGVITNGTASRARIGRPAAGKTGTSQNYRDAWFVGYTPQLSTSVWVGYYKTELPMNNVRGQRGFGGTLSAPIWAAFMKAAHADLPVMDFEKQARPEYKMRPEWDSRIQVPSLAGMTREEAVKAMEETGLPITFVEAYSAEIPAGKVISQNPAGGAKVSPGASVTITVSKGPEPAAPPAPKPPDPFPKPPPPSEPTTPAP
ncbi:MAG: PBP1A family penicillin-binding protein [Coriobacteriia bacterium]|nr:PBP1A family penicillin-binding protein [Coriobacteriia bacterium]